MLYTWVPWIAFIQYTCAKHVCVHDTNICVSFFSFLIFCAFMLFHLYALKFLYANFTSCSLKCSFFVFFCSFVELLFAVLYLLLLSILRLCAIVEAAAVWVSVVCLHWNTLSLILLQIEAFICLHIVCYGILLRALSVSLAHHVRAIHLVGDANERKRIENKSKN